MGNPEPKGPGLTRFETERLMMRERENFEGILSYVTKTFNHKLFVLEW